MDNPRVPGAALRGELAGHYKIKLRKQGCRLVYGVQDDFLVVMVMVLVMVMAVGKREDSAAYQSAVARLSEKVSEVAKAAQRNLKH